MLRVRCIAPICASALPLRAMDQPPSKERDVQETGLDRVKRIWSSTPDGQWSNEFHFAVNTAAFSSVIGFLMGGMRSTATIPSRFKEENQATIFQDQADARRVMRMQMSLEFYKGGFRMAGRIALFSFVFGSVLVSSLAYRNKDDILNFVISGGIVGAIFKLWQGLRATLVGVLFGGVFGGLLGTMISAVSIFTGVTLTKMLEINGELHRVREERLESFLPINKDIQDAERKLRAIQEGRIEPGV